MASMSSSQSSSPSSSEDDLFKKFKLKQYRTIKHLHEGDLVNSDEGSLPDMEQVEFLTPDIDDLQRQENDLLKYIQSPTVNTKNDDKNLVPTQNHRKTCNQCGVCNDEATGIHYGVATCEGCKGNF